MGGCSVVCRNTLPVLQGAVVPLYEFEEDILQRELYHAEQKKMKSVPVLSIRSSSLYRKRRSLCGSLQAQCDDTKDSSVQC
jgi:hypothetical protein